MDVLTGSYNPGHLYLFARKDDGTFAKGEKLKYSDGELIVLNSASTPFAVDWDSDGDLDMLVGDIRGHAWFVEKTDEGFSKGVKLQFDGKDLKADHGDSQPVAADWNGDGTLDLVFPHGSGKVDVYPGIKGKGAPELGKPETIVTGPDRSRTSNGTAAGGTTNTAEKEVKPGMRAKICVTDWNGDGVLDLLLGDYETIMLPAPELTEEEQKIFEELKEEQQKNTQELMDIINKVREDLEEKMGKKVEDMTDEERKKFNSEYAEKVRGDETYLEISKKNREIYTKMRKYQGGYERRGNVWLFKGKQADPVTGEKTSG